MLLKLLFTINLDRKAQISERERENKNRLLPLTNL